MAGIDEVTPHIEIEGGAEAASTLENIGTTGEKAFEKIGESASTATEHMGAIDAAAKRLGISYEEMAAKVAGASEAAEEAFQKINEAASTVGAAGHAVASAAEEGKKSLHELGTIGAEAFAKIMEAATHGNLTGVVTKMFGELAGTLAEAAKATYEFIHTQAELIETLNGLATATGMTLPQILAMREAFATVGISTNGFERSIGRLAITISNEWTHIQQAVRTSADQQIGAMLHVAQAALNLEKAHHSMSATLTESSKQAAHNAFGIESASIGLKRAGEALSDYLLQSRSNTLGIEGAELALTRARMNLAKDQGHAVSPQDEKALKLAQDTLAVKQAELALSEAHNKKRKEATELEQINLNAKKAAQEAIDAQNKSIEDSIKMSDRLKEARLHEQQAALAVREAQEKQHESDLKNIPAIARELEQVANKQKDWASVINNTELSAQNLGKAIVLAASSGGEKPTTLAVFEKMMQLFPQIKDESIKLAMVQHMMGAGFRAGQASAAQLLAVMQRGPEAMNRLTQGTENFLKAIGDPRLDKSKHQLEEFNAASALLGSTFDTLKARIGGILSVPVAEFLTKVRESLVSTDGYLNKLAVAFTNATEGVANLAKGLGELAAKIVAPAWAVFIDILTKVLNMIGEVGNAIGKLSSYLASLAGSKVDIFFVAFSAAMAAGAVATSAFARSLALLLGRLAIFPIGIGLMITAVGDLVKAWAYARVHLPSWLGGGASPESQKATFDMGAQIEKMGQAVTRAGMKMFGATDRGMDESGRGGGVAGGVFGNSEEIKKMLGEPSHELTGAGHTLNDAGHALQQAAAAQRENQTRNNATPDAIRERLKDMHPPDRTIGSGLETKGADKLEHAAGDTRAAAGETRTAAQATSTAAQQTGSAADKFGTVGNLWASVVAAFQIAIGQMPKAAPGGGGEGKAGGGMIRGPGSPTSDTAGLFALSDGEYVMRSAAVSHYGPQLFEALNSLALGGFATGGIVGARGASASAAIGGSGPPSILNLSIDGNHFNGLKAPEHVASKLKSYAVSRQTSAAQKMPSWMR